jgi:hypothetical protein
MVPLEGTSDQMMMVLLQKLQKLLHDHQFLPDTFYGLWRTELLEKPLNEMHAIVEDWSVGSSCYCVGAPLREPGRVLGIVKSVLWNELSVLENRNRLWRYTFVHHL